MSGSYHSKAMSLDLDQLEIKELLVLILLELRKLNTHMEMVNDEEVTYYDIRG